MKQEDPVAVTVTVVDDNDGSLEVTKSYGSSIPEYVNTLTAKTSIGINGEKNLSGSAVKVKTFNFNLTPKSGDDKNARTASVTYAAGEKGNRSLNSRILTMILQIL